MMLDPIAEVNPEPRFFTLSSKTGLGTVERVNNLLFS